MMSVSHKTSCAHLINKDHEKTHGAFITNIPKNSNASSFANIRSITMQQIDSPTFPEQRLGDNHESSQH